MFFSFLCSAAAYLSAAQVPYEYTATYVSLPRNAAAHLMSDEYLRQFVGFFDGRFFSLEIQMRGENLIAICSGYPDRELIPEKPYCFYFKGLEEVSIQFQPDSIGSMKELLLNHPYGKFSLKPRKSRY